MLFIQKKDGSLRMYIDQQLKQITIKNKYPVSRIDNLFNKLQSASYFSKIDFRSTYHRLWVGESDKMASKT